jgi:coproporphyrinogen III oxidase-like Fe-S oxidoreductase
LESELEDFFLTNLRLASGFAEKTFEKRFGFSFFSRYQNQFETLHKMGLLEQKEGCIRATDRGILLLDRILINLF